jgi:hypothetical protein
MELFMTGLMTDKKKRNEEGSDRSFVKREKAKHD